MHTVCVILEAHHVGIVDECLVEVLEVITSPWVFVISKAKQQHLRCEEDMSETYTSKA